MAEIGLDTRLGLNQVRQEFDTELKGLTGREGVNGRCGSKFQIFRRSSRSASVNYQCEREGAEALYKGRVWNFIQTYKLRLHGRPFVHACNVSKQCFSDHS